MRVIKSLLAPIPVLDVNISLMGSNTLLSAIGEKGQFGSPKS